MDENFTGIFVRFSRLSASSPTNYSSIELGPRRTMNIYIRRSNIQPRLTWILIKLRLVSPTAWKLVSRRRGTLRRRLPGLILNCFCTLSRTVTSGVYEATDVADTYSYPLSMTACYCYCYYCTKRVVPRRRHFDEATAALKKGSFRSAYQLREWRASPFGFLFSSSLRFLMRSGSVVSGIQSVRSKSSLGSAHYDEAVSLR